MAQRPRPARGSRRGIVLTACAVALAAAAPASADIGFVGKWGSSGSGDGEFVGPRSLALDSAGDVYVADTNALMNISRVQKFTAAGAFITKFGSAGPPMVTELDAWGVAAASPSEIYVVDSYNEQIERFTSTVPPSTYTHAAAWSSDGPQSEFVSPRGLAVDSGGNVYVASSGNDLVQKFTASGVHLDTIGGNGSGDGELNQPYDVTVAADGTVYVADTRNHRVQRFSAGGDFMTKWGGAGSGPGQFVHPYAVATDPAGNVYVADHDNDRIQKFAEGGAPISKTPVPSTPTPGTKKKPKKTSGLWRLIPKGPGCTPPVSGFCYVEIVVPEPGEVTANTPKGGGASMAAKRKRAKPGIRRVKRRVAKAGKVRLKLYLNKPARKIMRRKGKIAVRVRLTFKPKQGKAVSTTRTFTFKKKAKKKRRSG